MEDGRYRSETKPRKCPKCGTNRIASYLYGMPDMNEKMERNIDAGRVVIGGCCIGDDDPRWQCVECGANIYSEPLT